MHERSVMRAILDEVRDAVTGWENATRSGSEGPQPAADRSWPALRDTDLGPLPVVCRSERVSAVREIQVEVGEFSGVEPLLLAEAFEQIDLEPLLAGAQLRIHVVPLLLRCEVCAADHRPDAFRFRCPRCGSGMRVVQGDQVVLSGLVVDTEACSTEPRAFTGQWGCTATDKEL